MSRRLGPIANFPVYVAVLVALLVVFRLCLLVEKSADQAEREAAQAETERVGVGVPGWLLVLVLVVSYFGIHLTARFATDRSWRRVEPHERTIHWNLWDVLVLAVAFVVFLSVLGLIGHGILKDDTSRDLASSLFMPIGYFMALALWAQVVRVRGGDPWKELGLRGVRLRRLVRIGALAFVAYYPCQFIVGIGLEVLFNALRIRIPTPGEHPTVQLFLAADSALIQAAVLGLLLISAPFFEEVLLRGLLYKAVRARASAPVAVVASAALFGVMHKGLYPVVNIFFLGLVLAYLVEKTGSIVPAVSLHFLNNLMATITLTSSG